MTNWDFANSSARIRFGAGQTTLIDHLFLTYADA
jgi:hypothetical protein